MEKVFILFSFGFTVICSAQKSVPKGKIIYEEIAGKSVEQLQMWFDNSSYLYYRNFNDDFSNVKFNSKEDSLANIEKIELRKSFMSSQPPQTWYGDLKSNIVVNSAYINKKFYCVADTMEFVNWDILEDTMRIDGLLCQKAAGITPKGTKISAWFTPSIPVSVAPYTLRGLPGLLVSAKYETNAISIRMLRLEWPAKENPTLTPPGNCLVMSKENRIEIINETTKEALKLAEYYRKQLKDKKRDN